VVGSAASWRREATGVLRIVKTTMKAIADSKENLRATQKRESWSWRMNTWHFPREEERRMVFGRTCPVWRDDEKTSTESGLESCCGFEFQRGRFRNR